MDGETKCDNKIHKEKLRSATVDATCLQIRAGRKEHLRMLFIKYAHALLHIVIVCVSQSKQCNIIEKANKYQKE